MTKADRDRRYQPKIKAKRAARKAAGLCMFCAKPLDGKSLSSCIKCGKANQHRQSERKERMAKMERRRGTDGNWTWWLVIKTCKRESASAKVLLGPLSEAEAERLLRLVSFPGKPKATNVSIA